MSISREQEMISAYLDGEVPDPWRSRMPGFIEADSRRADTLNRFQRVKDALGTIPEKDVDAAQERVWNSLQKRVAHHPVITVVPHDTWWRRAVAIPLPAAAAVVIAFVGVAFFALRTPTGNQSLPIYQTTPESLSISALEIPQEWQAGVQQDPQQASFTEPQFSSDLQLHVQIDSIAQLLEVLAAQNVVRDVTISLPQNSRFGIHGEPALMRASEVGSWGGR